MLLSTIIAAGQGTTVLCIPQNQRSRPLSNEYIVCESVGNQSELECASHKVAETPEGTCFRQMYPLASR
jgi:hypothetical protein